MLLCSAVLLCSHVVVGSKMFARDIFEERPPPADGEGGAPPPSGAGEDAGVGGVREPLPAPIAVAPVPREAVVGGVRAPDAPRPLVRDQAAPRGGGGPALAPAGVEQPAEVVLLGDPVEEATPRPLVRQQAPPQPSAVSGEGAPPLEGPEGPAWRPLVRDQANPRPRGPGVTAPAAAGVPAASGVAVTDAPKPVVREQGAPRAGLPERPSLERRGAPSGGPPPGPEAQRPLVRDHGLHGKARAGAANEAPPAAGVEETAAAHPVKGALVYDKPAWDSAPSASGLGDATDDLPRPADANRSATRAQADTSGTQKQGPLVRDHGVGEDDDWMRTAHISVVLVFLLLGSTQLNIANVKKAAGTESEKARKPRILVGEMHLKKGSEFKVKASMGTQT